MGRLALAALREGPRGGRRHGAIRPTGASPSASASPTTSTTAQRYGKSAGGPVPSFYFKQLLRKLVTAGGRSNLFKLDPDEPDASITPERVTNELVIAGTVESVVEQLLAFRRTTGDFGTLLYACMDWKDERLGRRSMQLLAEEVMPRLNAELA